LYRSNINTKHSVDAGLIGCIRLNEINIEKLNEEEMERLGAIVDFPHDFITREEDGKITFGRVTIDTDSDEDMYDEDEDEEYEY